MVLKEIVSQFVIVMLLVLGLFFSPGGLAQAPVQASSQPLAAHAQSTSSPNADTPATAKTAHQAKHPLILFWIMLSLFIVAALGGVILVGGLILLDNPLLTRIGGFILIAAIPLAFVCLAIGYLIE